MTACLHNTEFLGRTANDAVRSLDPAANVDPQLVASPRAQDTRARILATDSAEPALAPPIRTGLVRTPRRRWVLAGAAMVGVGALVVAPGMLGGQNAFASWSATAKSVPPAEAAVAGKDCRTQWGGPGGVGPGSDGKVVETADTVLVERRGAWTFVLLRGVGGFEANCLNKDKGTGDGFTGTGSTGTYDVAAVASNTVAIHTLGVGGDDQSSYGESTGRVGSDVASVVINTAQQGPVEATVHGGYFAAWWPGPGVVHGEKPGPDPTYTLILKDGTTKADIPMVQLWARSS
ncbi:MAG: hypothetical protein ACYDC9_12440 [Dermatophilaceae bacterium]